MLDDLSDLNSGIDLIGTYRLDYFHIRNNLKRILKIFILKCLTFQILGQETMGFD